MRLFALLVASVVSGLIGGLVVLVGMSARDQPPSATMVSSLVPPMVVVPVPLTSQMSPAAATLVEAFRAAGLDVGSLQEVTTDSPCYYPAYVSGGVQFAAGRSGEGFCVLSYSRESDREAAWGALLRMHDGYARRMTVRGGLVLVYIGASPDLAYRYETVLVGLP